MVKTQKELAFLRDLYITEEWTKRFTDLVDKHLDLRDSDNLLYLNAGTGFHAMAVDERFGEKTDIFATCENEDMLTIARDKAAAISSKVDFSTIRFEDDAFDAVLTDATFADPAAIASLIENTARVARTGGDVALFLPTAGSFGEIFSLLWEAMYNEDLLEYGPVVENLIAALPTISHLETLAAGAGMINVNTETSIEAFEFDDGAEFVGSPLVSDFLMPVWLSPMAENERERVLERLAQNIDAEDGKLTFRFTVKATLLTGEKD
ncbi:MAG: class I SAM-dependent methyltransferase [Pyrinomonadaceae bacterium]|nr:class I SAM-dependent methyltransferase [Pyrinomonadaceae bacterium]